mgnify:CR=1 FL=1
MALDSMKEIFERSARENIPFWEIVLQYDMEERQVSRQASMAKMLSTWRRGAGGAAAAVRARALHAA